LSLALAGHERRTGAEMAPVLHQCYGKAKKTAKIISGDLENPSRTTARGESEGDRSNLNMVSKARNGAHYQDVLSVDWGSHVFQANFFGRD